MASNVKGNNQTAEERMEEYIKTHGTFFWKPYEWQDRLLRAVREKNITAAISSNKIGKCICYQVLIDTPRGKITVGDLYKQGKPFNVYAWDGNNKVIAKASAPFKKEGLHKCYRVTMSDGQWIEAADHHMVLTSEGWHSFEWLHQYVSSRLPSSSGISPSTHVSDVSRWSEKVANYPVNCLVGSHQCGGQPLFYQGSGPTFVPLSTGSRLHSLYCSRLGELVEKHKHNLLSLKNGLLYTVLRFVAQSVESLNRIFCTNYLQLTSEPQVHWQPHADAFVDFRQVPVTDFRTADTSPSAYCSPLLLDDVSIVSSKYIGCQEVYDFTVEKYHNYCAGGLVHHNTCCVVNILVSWLLGYEPWTQGYDSSLPDAIEEGGQWYRTSSLGIKPPVNLMLTGEDWKSHIGRSLVPEFKKWLPVGWYTSKKNEQGVEYFFEMRNKSTVTVMSYSQDDDLFESFRIQGVLMDEPPPKSKYVAMSRGLLLDNGKTLLSLTPLKEAWILDDIVLSGRKDIGIVDNLSIADNPDLLMSETEVLRSMGLKKLQRKMYFDLLFYDNPVKQTPVSDQGRKAVKFLEDNVELEKQSEISKLKMLKFIRDIDPADVPPRVFGQFKSLVGRVLKEFDVDIHIIDPFEVPTDWPVVAMIDFHLSTPQMVSFYAVDKHDMSFCFDEVWENYSGDEVADAIIKRKIKYGLKIEDAYIDPLSKGDVSYLKNRLGSDLRDTFSIIEEKLSRHGITLHVASKDKDSGIKNLQTMLRGVNRLPTFFVCRNCERFIYEVSRWVFDEDGKPIKENDHAMENAYRYTLTGLKYEDHVIRPINQYRPVSQDSWMGA